MPKLWSMHNCTISPQHSTEYSGALHFRKKNQTIQARVSDYWSPSSGVYPDDQFLVSDHCWWGGGVGGYKRVAGKCWPRLERGWGVSEPPILADIVCEQPLKLELYFRLKLHVFKLERSQEIDEYPGGNILVCNYFLCCTACSIIFFSFFFI